MPTYSERESDATRIIALGTGVRCHNGQRFRQETARCRGLQSQGSPGPDQAAIWISLPDQFEVRLFSFEGVLLCDGRGAYLPACLI